MAILIRSDSTVQSVFGIHGDDENDMSAGFAYLLARSEALLEQVINDLVPRLSFDPAGVEVRLQTYRRGEGITDIELFMPSQAFIVFEAKKGMALPSLAQLTQYVPRCKSSECQHSLLVALTALRQEPALHGLPALEIDGVPVTARSWEWLRGVLARTIKKERGSHLRWLLGEYRNYLEEFMGNDRVLSNLVYVVSLASGKPEGWSVSWIDIVVEHHRYFYPVSGGGWPPPPNYLGFRYGGRLQAIHHVDEFQVVADLREHFPGSEAGQDWGPHYLLKLGPRIEPPHEVKNGPRVLRSARVWCMLDTLLTSSTVSDALTETEKRRNQEAI